MKVGKHIKIHGETRNSEGKDVCFFKQTKKIAPESSREAVTTDMFHKWPRITEFQRFSFILFSTNLKIANKMVVDNMTVVVFLCGECHRILSWAKLTRIFASALWHGNLSVPLGTECSPCGLGTVIGRRFHTEQQSNDFLLSGTCRSTRTWRRHGGGRNIRAN